MTLPNLCRLLHKLRCILVGWNNLARRSLPIMGPRSSSTSISDVLTVLGEAGVGLASSPSGRDLAVHRTALFDPHSGLEDGQGCILLVPWLTVSDPAARSLLDDAAQRGFAAVVLKAHGASPDDLARAADTAGVALLVVHDSVDWLHLDALVNNALTTANQVGRSLSSLAIGDLFALAGAIADAVGGATAIEDFSQRILAYSSDPAHPTDADRREGILGRQVPDIPVNDEQYRELYRARHVVRFPAEPPALPRMAVAVRAGQELLGSIWVIDPGEGLGRQAEQALVGAAPIAALHLLRARSSEQLARQQRGEMVCRLFEGVPDSHEAAAVLGLDTQGPFAVLAFTPTDARHRAEDPALVRLLDLATVHCETRVGHTGATMIDGTVYCLAAGRRAGSVEVLEQLAAAVVTGAKGALHLDLLAAVSSVVDDIQLVAEVRTDVRDLVSLLRQRPDLGPVGTVDRLWDQLALGRLASVLESDVRLVSRTARAMSAHDRERGTEYVRWVRAYLASLRDVTAAASRLSMHPNTLRYRLRRAAELFDIDLSDPDQVLVLWVALRSLSFADVAARPDRPPGVQLVR